MKSKTCMICIFVLVIIIKPYISMATPPGLTTILGVKIHLKNNDVLEGYIETYLYLKGCDEKITDHEEDNVTLKEFLDKKGKLRHLAGGGDSIRFIKELKDFHDGETTRPVVTRSNVKKIRINSIKSIKSVCRKWDGHKTMSGIPIITDYMAKYISDHKLIAVYVYNPEDIGRAKDNAESMAHDAAVAAKEATTAEEIAEAEAKAKEAARAKVVAAEELYDPDDYALINTYLSYNPKYTRKELIKLRTKIDKMSNDALDKEKLIIFFEAFD
jgi:hypothetical protein